MSSLLSAADHASPTSRIQPFLVVVPRRLIPAHARPNPRSAPSAPFRSPQWIALFLTVAMVLTQVVSGLMEMKGDGLANLWPASTLTAGLMLLFGCFNTAQFDTSLLWNVYLTIAAAFGVSTCMENTGVASMIANRLISLGTSMGGDTPVLIAIYVATAILSELLTNNAVRSSAAGRAPADCDSKQAKKAA